MLHLSKFFLFLVLIVIMSSGSYLSAGDDKIFIYYKRTFVTRDLENDKKDNMCLCFNFK